VDPNRVGVGGDSAGGNVAAVVAHEYVAGPRPPLALQVLTYPHVSGDHDPARARHASGGTLNEREMRWFEMHTAGALDPTSTRHVLLGKELTGLPPAIVVTAGHDPLRDEAIVYLDCLRASGVRAEHVHFSDDVHGFFTLDLILDNSSAALAAVADIAADMLDLKELRGTAEISQSRPIARVIRRTDLQVRYLMERMMYQHVQIKRKIVRSMGLPVGRDITALNSQIKQLENQVRQLRRQLDRALSDEPSP